MPAQKETVSVIAADLRIEGTVTSQSALMIYGTIHGNISARSVKIDTGARVEGNIDAERVDLEGAVEGDIRASHLRLGSGARLKGNFWYRTMSMEPGADFEGRSSRLKDDKSPEIPALWLGGGS